MTSDDLSGASETVGLVIGLFSIVEDPAVLRRFASSWLTDRPAASWGDWKHKYRKRKYRRNEYASTEYVSTSMQGWKMQVWKTQVRSEMVENVSSLKSILKSLRFSSLAFSVDPLSVGLDQFTCTVPDRCYTQDIGLMRRRAWVQQSQVRRCRVTVLGKLFTPIVPLFIKQRNW